MSLRLPAAIAALALLAGCATPVRPVSSVAETAASGVASAATQASPPPNDNLDALAWSQTAIEHDLIYLQTYRDAQARLLGALKDSNWDALPTGDRVASLRGLPPAIVLDIDETVLDNSPFQARLIRRGGEYNEADWAAWCNEQRARAMPGAVALTRFAAQHGIAVIYISNRAKTLERVTLANLRQAGLPVSGPGALLGLGTTVEGCIQRGSDKGCRRQQIGRHYRVLMQFGDQLGDFVDAAANTAAARSAAVAPYMGWIGTRWFMLPNPTYGAWQSVLFHNDRKAPAGERRRQILEALRY
jgi:5'-nucleotidase (lipoprotein e(P4) family)